MTRFFRSVQEQVVCILMIRSISHYNTQYENVEENTVTVCGPQLLMSAIGYRILNVRKLASHQAPYV